MRTTFTEEEIARFRTTIRTTTAELKGRDGDNLVPKPASTSTPAAAPQSQSIGDRIYKFLSSRSVPANTPDTSLSPSSSQPENYDLVMFLNGIYQESLLSTVSRHLNSIHTLPMPALLFFLQALPPENPSHQNLVNENCIAKISLISQNKICWEDVNSIDTPDHPLLNPQAILRMAGNNGTSLKQELAALQSRKDSELLLGDIFEQALIVELDRLSKLDPVLDNANNKASKLSHWLRAAQKQYPIEANAGRLARHHKFAFYKAFQSTVGEKETVKNIEEVLSQKRYGIIDAKDSHSYEKIIKIKALLNAYQAELQKESAYGLLPKFEAELALASISLIQDPVKRSAALEEFRSSHPKFRLTYLQSTTSFVFESGSLATLLSTLHESEDYKKPFCEQLQSHFGKASESKPDITWQQIKQEILAYQARKIEKHSKRPSLTESNTANNAEEQSRRPSLVGAYAASVKGRRPSLISGGTSSLAQELNDCFDHNDATVLTALQKEDIIVKIYRRITSLGFNKQGKELSESGLMAANLLNLLYGFNSHPAEILGFLKGFSGEEELRHSVKAHFTLTLEQQLDAIKIGDTETDSESITPPANHAAVVASQHGLSSHGQTSEIELKVAAVPAPVENR